MQDFTDTLEGYRKYCLLVVLQIDGFHSMMAPGSRASVADSKVRLRFLFRLE